MRRAQFLARLRQFSVPAFAFVLAACANATTVQQVPADAGVARSFNASYDEVRAAALQGLTLLRLQPSAQNETPEGHTFMVARPPHGFSWGEVGRIIVEKSEAPPTTVRVVYERRMALQFAGGQSSFARNLFAKMDQALSTTEKSTDSTLPSNL
jgi:hypothetical protein